MIYLVKLDEIYKIGFSKDVEKRVNSFKISHLEVELLHTREGEIKHEKMLHKACAKFHIKGELFESDSKVREIFKTYVFDDYVQENIELKKEVKKLEEKVTELEKQLLSRETFKIELVESDAFELLVELDLLCNGKNVKCPISKNNNFLKIGELILYSKSSGRILTGYGADAKIYTTKAGIELYYIATGAALSKDKLFEIIEYYK